MVMIITRGFGMMAPSFARDINTLFQVRLVLIDIIQTNIG